MGAHHDLGGDIEIRDLISLGDERGRPGGAWIGFDDIYFLLCAAFGYPDGKLDIDQSPDIEGESNLPGVFNHLVNG